MIALEAKVKKWGNSLGIVLPKEMAMKRNISEDDQVKIVITRVGRKNASRRLWGALHN
ncbi:AbrB/MazE/SpoVT family DNA-binding domain-containing protein, partial [Candidatus Woesearchaeota archaeon]|nr:AbrB/MazE/SpoVT family DNA-binding domain-containing protein [Candidatus Woesearchaeota archaeon]